MQVYHKLKDFTKKYPRMAVALGMFDGVHIGHQSIIRRAVDLARSAAGTSAVFTFSNHPLSVLSPQHMPLQLGTEALKEQLIGELGVDVLVSIPFTREFAQRTPEEFLELLRADFAPRFVVTGPNYTFGQRGRGTHRQLLRDGPAYGFQTEICPAVLRGGRIVSSTRIRALIAEGELAMANDFLGHPFRLVERVIHGDRRGRTLGFPTANLPILPGVAMLPNGAYAVRVAYDGQWYGGMASIGSNPTFEGCSRRVEVNIADFSADIYDRELTVDFLAKLRDEQRFASAEQLVRQLTKDRARAAAIWRTQLPS